MKLFSLIQAASTVTPGTVASTAAEEVKASFSERVATGLGNLVLGMLVVFAVLTVLWLVLEFVGRLFANADKKAAAKKAEEAAKNPAPAPAPAVAEEEDNEEEIVAAITAAVALMLEAENGEAPAFKVVSFRKTYSKQSWNN